MVEATGQVIIELWGQLEQIKSNLDANGGSGRGEDEAVVRGAIERAEAVLRRQAREIVDAAKEQPSAYPALPAPTSPGPPSASSTWPPAQGSTSPPRPDAPRYSPHATRLPPTGAQRSGARSAGARQRTKPQGPFMPLRARSKGKPQRLDPLEDPPLLDALSSGEVRGGILTLSHRGVIPKDADVTAVMDQGYPVVLQSPMLLYDQASKHERQEVSTGIDLLTLKLSSPPDFNRTPTLPQTPNSARSGSAGRPKSGDTLPALPGPRSETQLALPGVPEDDREGDLGDDDPPEAPPQQVDAEVTKMTHSKVFFTDLQEGDGETQEKAEETLAVCDMTQELLRQHAATVIASAWKGFRTRRAVRNLRFRHAMARRIQRAWAAAKARGQTKLELEHRRELARKRHVEMIYSLGQEWFHAKQRRRLEIHVCSNTMPTHRRGKVFEYQALQASQICRIFRLLDQRLDVIFVAPRRLHEDIMDYYCKIMQYRGVRNPPGRFQVVAPDLPDLPDTLSLTQALLCSAKALKRIRRLCQNRPAALVPDIVTPQEVKLASELDVPLLGPPAKNASLLSSKSHMKRIVSMAELPMGPWAVDIYDEDEFYASLADALVRHANIQCWAFKIDDERASRGTAYIDLQQLKPVVNLARQVPGPTEQQRTASQMSRQSEERPVTLADVEAALRKYLPKKVVLCNRRAYEDFKSWMAEACRVGLVIQAVPSNILSQTTVHLQVEPNASVYVLGSSEAVSSQPFVHVASWYPHTKGSWEVLKEAGMRIGRVLAAKGLIGFASVDVVFFENPAFSMQHFLEHGQSPTPMVIGPESAEDTSQLMFTGMRSPSPSLGSELGDLMPSSFWELPEAQRAEVEEAKRLQEEEVQARTPIGLMLGPRVYASPLSKYACWIVDVDVRLTDEAAVFFPLQLISQVRVDQETGHLRLTPEALAAEQAEGAGSAGKEDPHEQGVRWALVNHTTSAPGMEKSSYPAVFQMVKMRGVSFDLLSNLGCAFTYLDVFHGLFSILAVERRPSACLRRVLEALNGLAEGLGIKEKLAPPRDAPPMVKGTSEVHDGLLLPEVRSALRLVSRQLEASSTQASRK
mmetsp:Transcript_13831/g.32628  ORF Transcript_13831/g.32628 Transcript_13831/m.32628 type:complete len:1087 (-) Transcript_13831:51-3311(-)